VVNVAVEMGGRGGEIDGQRGGRNRWSSWERSVVELGEIGDRGGTDWRSKEKKLVIEAGEIGDRGGKIGGGGGDRDRWSI
jgi:hypothetical protein